MVTSAAEKYHATLADNRKLFNEIQELKGAYLNCKHQFLLSGLSMSNIRLQPQK